MSRLAPAPSPALPGFPRSFLLLASWHIGCSCLGTGCLYTAGVVREEVNEEPIIVDPEGEEGEEHPFVLFLEDRNFARVLAIDPEGGPLDIFWFVPGEPNPEEDLSQEDDIWVGLLFLPRDPAYQDMVVRATVVDDARSSVDVLFRVEVP